MNAFDTRKISLRRMKVRRRGVAYEVSSPGFEIQRLDRPPPHQSRNHVLDRFVEAVMLTLDHRVPNPRMKRLPVFCCTR
jgi:hypothetical protein